MPVRFEDYFSKESEGMPYRRLDEYLFERQRFTALCLALAEERNNLGGDKLRKDSLARQADRYLRLRTDSSLRSGLELPLEQLMDTFDLDDFSRFCLQLALWPEVEDGTLRQEKKTLNLGDALWLYSLFGEASQADAASFFTGNRLYLFVESKETTPYPERELRLNEKARSVALGASQLQQNLRPYCRYLEENRDEEYELDRPDVGSLMLHILDEGEGRTCINLTGVRGSGRKRSLERFHAQTGIPILCLDCRSAFSLAEGDMRRLGFDLVVEQLVGGALLLLDCFDEPAENLKAKQSLLLHELLRHVKLVLLSTQEPYKLPQSEEASLVSLAFRLPSARESAAVWAGEGRKYQMDGFAPKGLATKYRVSVGFIKKALHSAALSAAAEGAGSVDMRRISKSVQAMAIHNMDEQARRINAFYTWEDLVLEQSTMQELKMLCNRVKYSAAVMEDWGFSSKLAYGKAVSALFYGVPGTGKTMAAQVIAGDLDLELYRVDLSQIINKYVGETEKNLAKIFDEAERCNGILFFDEADALFAKRTEITDSKDKYANAETAFLLQKIEEFNGMVILATNLAYNFDDAFKRRINYMINFLKPGEELRRQLWQKVFPAQLHVEQRLDLDFLAKEFELTGSSIKAIAVSAAYLAASQGEEIQMHHVIRALRHEYVKSGEILLKAKMREYSEI